MLRVARIQNPAFVRAVIGQKDSGANTSSRTVAALRGIAAELGTPEAAVGRATLRRITRRINVGEDRLRAKIELAGAGNEDADALAGAAPLMIDEPITIVRRGAELRLVLRGASADGRAPDAPMIRLLIHARRWFAAWREGNGSSSLSDIAEAHGVNVGDVSRAVQFAFLAPDLVERILDGCQPANLTVTGLKRTGDLPLLWDEQITALS